MKLKITMTCFSMLFLSGCANNDPVTGSLERATPLSDQYYTKKSSDALLIATLQASKPARGINNLDTNPKYTHLLANTGQLMNLWNVSMRGASLTTGIINLVGLEGAKDSLATWLRVPSYSKQASVNISSEETFENTVNSMRLTMLNNIKNAYQEKNIDYFIIGDITDINSKVYLVPIKNAGDSYYGCKYTDESLSKIKETATVNYSQWPIVSNCFVYLPTYSSVYLNDINLENTVLPNSNFVSYRVSIPMSFPFDEIKSTEKGEYLYIPSIQDWLPHDLEAFLELEDSVVAEFSKKLQTPVPHVFDIYSGQQLDFVEKAI